MGQHNHPPGYWQLHHGELWNALGEAVDNAVQEVNDDRPEGDGDVDPRLVADMLDYIAKCYREHLRFDGTPEPR